MAVISNALPSDERGFRSERALALIDSLRRESALDAGALGFMAKFLVQTTLPHSEQTGTQYMRTDGNVTSASRMSGDWPALWQLSTPDPHLDDNRSRPDRESRVGAWLLAFEFHGATRIQATGGHWGTIPRFRDQMQRLVGAAISTRWWSDATGRITRGGSNLLVADKFHLWWTPQKLPRAQLAKS